MREIIIVLLLCGLMLSTCSAGFPQTPNAGSDSLSSTRDSVSASAVDWWPMYHHDANRTGYSTSLAPGTNQSLWKYTTGYYVYSSPAVVDGKVYVGSYDNHLYCLNALTGAFVWSYDAGTGNRIGGGPAVAYGKVYVCAGWSLSCLDASTGALVWKKALALVESGCPAVSDNRVYVELSNGTLCCFDALNGNLLWNYKCGCSQGAPAVAYGRVYVGGITDWKVYCLNAVTGAFIWSRYMNEGLPFDPAVADGKVYLGVWYPTRVYCLDAFSGAYIWNYTINVFDAYPVSGIPAVAYGKVYFGAEDGKFYCLNALTGGFVWGKTLGGYGESVGYSPAVADNKVFVGGGWADGKLYCFSASSGSFIWSYDTGSTGQGISAPAIADTKVYIGGWDHKIYCLGSTASLVHLESREDTGVSSDLGKITFAGVTYGLPNDVSKPAGSYQAQYTAVSSTYGFDHWETSGGISVSSKYGNPTTVTVSGAGTLRAFYKTTIFSDAFESGSFSAWTGKSVSPGETATVVNTLKHHGAYSAKFTSNGTGGTEYAYCYKTISSSSELYARAYFYMSQSGIVDESDRFYLTILSGSSDVAYAGWKKTGGVVKWILAIKNGTSTEFAYSAGSPSLNKWYCVELHWKKSTTTGLGELYVNGARVCSLTGKNTTAYGSVSKARFGLSGIFYCAATTAYCDCVKVARTYVGPEFIFSDGFESGDFSSWTSKGSSTGETATVTSSISHHGNHSAKFTSNGNGGFEYASCYKNISPLSEVYARGYFRAAASGIVENGDRISFIAFANASGNYAAYAGWCKTGGVIKWFLALGSLIVYSTANPSLNTWYCVELHWKKGTTTGLGELYVNGAKVCSITGKNTAPYGSVSQAIFGLALLNCASATAYCDCTKIAANYIGPEY